MNHDCVFTTCDISGKLFDLSVPHFSSSVKWEKQWSRAHHIVLRFKWGRICKGHRQCSMCVTVYGWEYDGRGHRVSTHHNTGER